MSLRKIISPGKRGKFRWKFKDDSERYRIGGPVAGFDSEQSADDDLEEVIRGLADLYPDKFRRSRHIFWWLPPALIGAALASIVFLFIV